MTSRTAVGSSRFTKKERITQSQDFRTAMKWGRKASSRNFVVFIRKNEDALRRLGIVAKKEVGPATVRNRYKRYIREFFRLHKGRMKASCDIILMVKKGCSIRTYREAEEELGRLLQL